MPAAQSTARRAKSASTAATPTRSLRGDLKQFTREKIVAAALDAFAEGGYRGTSVERIVELAGTTAPTFYRHFGSKSDLLPPLQAFLAKEVAKVVHRLDSLEPRSLSDVRTWVQSFWTMWKRLRLLCAAYWEATMVDDDFAANIMPATLEIVDGLPHFLGGFAEDKREKFRLRLAVMLTLLDRIVYHAGAERNPERSKAMLDEYAEVFWLAIYSDARDLQG